MDNAWELLSKPRAPGEDGYFEHVRADLVALLEVAPRRFVEIGCGTGLTAASVKARFPSAIVDGFEYNAAAAAIAATRLDHVHTGNVELVDLGELYAPGSIDALLLADVLEHLYDPWALLKRIRPFLSADAHIIASIPNVRNIALLMEIAAGSFTYEPAGLLDVTHIRFFTLREIRKMFDATGYEVRSVANVQDPRFAPLVANVFPADVSTPGLVLKNLDAQALAELSTIQFTLSVRVKPAV